MLNNDFLINPVKPRRKHVDVPTHKPDKLEVPKIKKTYSANFNARKHRHKHHQSEVIIEIPEKESPNRISKKYLSKEIERLNQENETIAAKFNELEDLSVKRISKLKEKTVNLQNVNSDLVKECDFVKQQYNELLKYYEDLRDQVELTKVCTNCEELKEQGRKLNIENDALRRKNKEVNEDIGMLKTVVFRLNVQLERYQEKLRKHNLSIDKYSHLQSQKSSATQFKEDEIINILSSDHQGHRHTPVSWGSVNSHALGPLLDAYQDTINEKDEIIQTYELELANFTGKMKEVIEENENLFKKLSEDENCSRKLAVQLENVKEELKVTKDHNDALIKKCAIKQEKIEEILKVYENKVEQMKRDFQVVHEEYVKLRTENASLKEKIKSLINDRDDFKNERQSYIPIAVHTASVNECKKWYEELKLQYENEKKKLKENMEAQTKTINDLNESISNFLKVKGDLEAKVGKLEKELKKSEAKQLDLEHSLNEVQLSRSACRKQLHKAMCFAKDMVAEQETLIRALNQRQLENRAVKKIGSEMAVKMDSLKSQLKDVQKTAWQEFSTVEQKIQDQANMIDSMKENHEREVETLRKVIAEQEEKLTRQKKDFGVPLQFQMFKEKYK